VFDTLKAIEGKIEDTCIDKENYDNYFQLQKLGLKFLAKVKTEFDNFKIYFSKRKNAKQAKSST